MHFTRLLGFSAAATVAAASWANQTLAPDIFRISYGDLMRGDVADLQRSDDFRMVVRQRYGYAGNQANATVEASATTTINPVIVMNLRFETSCNGFPASRITQTIEVFNVISRRWDVVDTRPATLGDAVVEKQIVGCGVYFDSSGRTWARVNWFDRGSLTPTWVGAVDQVQWEVIEN